MKATLLALMFAIAASGCASGPQFSAPDTVPAGKAVVYVYRPKQIIGWGGLLPVNSPFKIRVNDSQPTLLFQGGYGLFLVDSGTNTFTGARCHPVFHYELEKYTLLQTNLVAASTNYFKFRVGALKPNLVSVPAEVGSQEMKGFKLETAKGAGK